MNIFMLWYNAFLLNFRRRIIGFSHVVEAAAKKATNAGFVVSYESKLKIFEVA